MALHHVTVVGRDREAMADLVRRHHLTVARHTVRERARGYLVHAYATDRQIRALEREGYGVRRLENVEREGKRRQAEAKRAALARVRPTVAARGAMAGYLTVDEIEAAVGALAAANEGFVERIPLPYPSWEGRSASAIRIGARRNGNGAVRPTVLLLGGVHAREWGSPDILVNFSRTLADAYASGRGVTLGRQTFSPAQIRDVVDRKAVVVFPQANPDGRFHSMESTAMWRKNRRPAPDGAASPDCVGVDLNRNYDFLWDFRRYFAPHAPIANSTKPCSHDTYIGPSAMSEPETRNVVWLLDRHPDVGWFVDVHSYSESILYAWGDDDDQSADPAMSFRNPVFDGQRGVPGNGYAEYLSKPDKAAVVRLARRMRDAIARVRGRVYRVQQSVGLYPTAGTSDDWAFSRHLVDPTKKKILAFTIEWGRETNPTPFHPPYREMAKIIDEITAALLELCVRAG